MNQQDSGKWYYRKFRSPVQAMGVFMDVVEIIGTKSKVMAKYDPNEHILLGEKYARDGFSNEQIAIKLGIVRGAYNLLLINISDFSDTIKWGKNFRLPED